MTSSESRRRRSVPPASNSYRPGARGPGRTHAPLQALRQPICRDAVAREAPPASPEAPRHGTRPDLSTPPSLVRAPPAHRAATDRGPRVPQPQATAQPSRRATTPFGSRAGTATTSRLERSTQIPPRRRPRGSTAVGARRWPTSAMAVEGDAHPSGTTRAASRGAQPPASQPWWAALVSSPRRGHEFGHRRHRGPHNRAQRPQRRRVAPEAPAPAHPGEQPEPRPQRHPRPIAQPSHPRFESRVTLDRPANQRPLRLTVAS